MLKPSAVSILGVVLAVAGSVWLVLVVTADRTAPDTADGTDDRFAGAMSLTDRPQFLDSGDLGTGSAEFSAVTINADLNRMVIADDQDRLYEFSLGDDGIPEVPPRRVIDVRFGGGDTEAIAWMYGSTFAIGSENAGTIAVVDIGDNVTTLDDADVVETIATGISEIDGSGLEGVAYLGENGRARFAVVSEKPPRLYLLGVDGAATQSFPLSFGIDDASDVAVAADGVITVLSDESLRVSTLAIDAAEGSVAVSRDGSLDIDAGAFQQPEGVVWSPDGTRMYIVGEAPGAVGYTFAIFAVDP